MAQIVERRIRDKDHRVKETGQRQRPAEQKHQIPCLAFGPKKVGDVVTEEEQHRGDPQHVNPGKDHPVKEGFRAPGPTALPRNSGP